MIHPLGLWPCCLICVLSGAAYSSPATGPLRVLSSNRRYFTDGSGKAIYLTGSHTWANSKDDDTVDPPAKCDFELYLNFMESHNHNFIRLWTRELPKFTWFGQTRYENQWPYPRTGPGNATDGKPKFDLKRFDQSYFDLLRSRVVAARDRGFYVAVMLFDGFGLKNNRRPDDGYAFTGSNNINGIDDGGGIRSQTLEHSAITAIQDRYVRKVIDTVNDLDNVLYEIADEAGPYSTDWQLHMIALVRAYEARKPKQHPVGMSFQWPGGSDDVLYGSAADWISPQAKVSPSDGTKVILNDTDHSYGWKAMLTEGYQAQRNWVWENFTQGAMPLFMDPYLTPVVDEKGTVRNTPNGHTPDPRWDIVRDNMGYALSYAKRMNLAAMTPQPNLSSTGYCMAHAGNRGEYLVYAPAGGAFSVDLSGTRGRLKVEWFNPTTGKIAGKAAVTGNAKYSFTPAFEGDAVLYLFQ